MNDSNPDEGASPGGPEDPEEVRPPAWSLFLMIAFPFAIVVLLLVLEAWLR